MPKDFEDVIASHANEFNLKQGDLDRAVREELTSLVAKRIAERIMAGEVTPPMSEGAIPPPPPPSPQKKKVVVGVASKRR